MPGFYRVACNKCLYKDLISLLSGKIRSCIIFDQSESRICAIITVTDYVIACAARMSHFHAKTNVSVFCTVGAGYDISR